MYVVVGAMNSRGPKILNLVQITTNFFHCHTKIRHRHTVNFRVKKYMSSTQINAHTKIRTRDLQLRKQCHYQLG